MGIMRRTQAVDMGQKAALLFAGGFFLALIAAVVLFLFHITLFWETGLEDSMRGEARQSLSALHGQIKQGHHLLDLLAECQEENSLSLEELYALARKGLREDGFSQIVFADQEGGARSTTGAQFHLDSMDCLAEALKGNRAVSFEDSFPGCGTEAVVLSVPLPSGGGAVLGVLQADVLAGASPMETMGQISSSSLVKGNGRMIAFSHSQENLIFSRGLSFEDNRAFQSVPELAGLPGAMVSGESGLVSYQVRGGMEYLYYTPAGVQDWYFIIQVPAKAVSDRVSSVLTWTAALCLATAGCFASLLAYMARMKSRSESGLHRLAFSDPLTGLNNSEGFSAEGERLLKAYGRQYAAAVFDINRFKLLNDKYGYSGGDQILRWVASSIEDMLGPRETAGRFFADEFCMLLDYNGEDSFSQRIRRLFEQINSGNGPKGPLAEELNFSCGVYVFGDREEEEKGGTAMEAEIPAGAAGVHAACDLAGIARKSLKGKYEGSLAFYSEEMRKEIQEEEEIERLMAGALAKEEFLVYFQPQYSLDGDVIAGAEALVRWQSPEMGFLSPYRFIPLFEKNGFITELDYYIFEKVCQALRTWLDRGYRCPPVAVNMSRLHVREPDFVERLLQIAKRWQIRPDQLELELTESVFVEDNGPILAVMHTLRQEGFLQSLDDFGSGYSSLNLLTEIPADIIKLDKEFFHAFDTNPKSKQVVSQSVRLVHELGMRVVAEGVETLEQVVFLKSIDCDMVQGFYFSKPLEAPAFERLIFPEGEASFCDVSPGRAAGPEAVPSASTAKATESLCESGKNMEVI